MTTAFTAIPKKMTTSAIFFLRGSMAEPYPMGGAPSIDPDQVKRISVEMKID